MRHLLQVLIQTLARCFQACAELLAAFGRAAQPAQGEASASAAFFGRAAGPPDDWARRASPPPPAHWVELVKRRAPGFLGKTSEASAPQAAALRPVLALRGEKVPLLPAPESRRPRASVLRAPDPAPRELARIPAFPLPPKTGPVPEAPPGKASRPTRIVTVIQESPRRMHAEAPAVARGAGERGIRESHVAENPGRKIPPGRNPQTILPPPQEEQAAPAPGPDPGRARKGTSEVSSDGEGWEPLPGPDPESPSPFAFPESTAIPVLERGPGRLRRPLPELLVFPSDSGRSEPRESPQSIPVAARWPELPASAERDDVDDARLLYRELRRQAVLEDEQRGVPWSA
ncbi:MAG TPA: hypothetical protein VMU54_05765 [Planctomycetota bacterium]|nr:hypothetical protein [Planctomycetota bacterium]